MTKKAHGKTLSQLAGDVRTGHRTARQLVELALDRVAKHQGLNAVVALRAEDALAEADAVDRAIASNITLGPLAGIPFLGKDNDDVKGLATTHGSRWFADAPPAEQDGVAVGRLRAAGAIPLGKSNVPEFCIEGFTDNLMFGPTRNPWHLDRSPGGSSGGSAAALSAGIVPIATATDGAGSSRIPAAFTGLLGFKPTTGVIGRRRAPEWVEFSTDGFMANSVDDLRTLLSVVAGPVDGDPAAPPHPLYPSRPPSRLIIAERTDDFGPLPQDVSSAFERAVVQLVDMLRIPTERRDPDSFFPGYSPDEDWFTIAAAEHASLYGRERIERDLAQLYPSTQEFLTSGLAISAEEYLAARRRRYSAVARLDDILAGEAALVTPVVAVSGYGVDGRIGDGEAGLLGPEVYSTAVQNVTNLPAISLPAGLTDEGMPFGIQVSMRRWTDLALLDLASRWEVLYPWPQNAPGFSPFG